MKKYSRRYHSINDGDYETFREIVSFIHSNNGEASQKDLIEHLVTFNIVQKKKLNNSKKHENGLENHEEEFKRISVDRARNTIRNARKINLINTDNNRKMHYNTDIGINLIISIIKKDIYDSKRWYFHSLMTFPLTRDILIIIYNENSPIKRRDIRHKLRHKGTHDIDWAIKYAETSSLLYHNTTDATYSLDRNQFCKNMLESTAYVLEKSYIKCIDDFSKIHTGLSRDIIQNLPFRLHVDEMIAQILNNKIWNIYGDKYNLEIFLYSLKDNKSLDFQASDSSGAARGVLGKSELSMLKILNPIKIDKDILNKSLQFIKDKKLKIKEG